MKQLFPYLALLLLLPSATYAQAPAVKLKGNPVNVSNPYHMPATSTKSTSDGGHIHAGAYFDLIMPGYMGHKIFLMKTDNTGATAWMKVYDIPETLIEDPAEVIQTADGGYAVVGQAINISGTTFDMDVFIIKTDPLGNMSWYNRYGSLASHETGYSIRELAAPEQNKFVVTGGVYPGGRITATGGIYIESEGDFFPYVNTEMKHVLVLKVNGGSSPAGQVLWSKMYQPADGSDESEGYKILELSSKDLILCGRNGRGNPIVYKLSSSGSSIWSKVYREAPGSTVSIFRASAVNMFDIGSGDFAITGNVAFTNNITGNWGSGAMLYTIDGAGIVNWSRYLEGNLFGPSKDSHTDDIYLDNNCLHIAGHTDITYGPHGPYEMGYST
jgi:hypothetical protein